jgi:hypothetical protein
MTEKTQKQKIKELLENSLFINPDEKKYWLSKLEGLDDSTAGQLMEILITEKQDFSELLKKIQKFDPEGAILKEFKNVVAKALKKMRDKVEIKEKTGIDEDLEKALKNV